MLFSTVLIFLKYHTVTNGLSKDLFTGFPLFRTDKFHDISMIFPGFLVKFQVFFSLFLKYYFQVVLIINMQTY